MSFQSPKISVISSKFSAPQPDKNKTITINYWNIVPLRFSLWNVDVVGYSLSPHYNT